MSRELKQLILWPDHIVSMENLLECFKAEYKHTKYIIDCSYVDLYSAINITVSSI